MNWERTVWNNRLHILTNFDFTDSAGTCSLSSSNGECVKYAQCRFALFFGSHNAAEIKNRKAACQLQGRDLLCCEKAGTPVFNNVAKTTTRTTTNRPGIKSTLKPLGLRPNQLGTTIANNNQNSPTRTPFNVALEQHPNFKRFDNKKCGPASVNRIANGKFWLFLTSLCNYIMIRWKCKTFRVSMGRTVGIQEKEWRWIRLRRIAYHW